MSNGMLKSSQSIHSSKKDLYSAIRHGDVEELNWLLNTRTINEQDSRSGHTFLAYAVLAGKTEVTFTLLKRGADPSIANINGETPLHLSSDNSELTITKILLEYKADPDLKTNDGETALHHAAYRGDSKMVDLLLKNGANPNVRNLTLGRTPFHYSVIFGNLHCIKLMLKAEANADILDHKGKAPFDYAEPELSSLLRRVQSQDLSLLSIVQEETESNQRTDENGNTDREAFAHISSENHSAKRKNLMQFLLGVKLECYIDVLIRSGFDDLKALCTQMDSLVPITEEMLQEIGIDKPGHRRRLLMSITKFQDTPLGCDCDNHINHNNQKTNLKEWMQALEVSEWHDLFLQAGYDDLMFLREHMLSSYPLNDAVLKYDIGVSKAGHRMRILGTLLEETKYLRNASSRKLCGSCRIM